MDIAGVWELTFSAPDNANDPLGINGISFLPGATWNELRGFVFVPYDPIPKDAKLPEEELAKFKQENPNVPYEYNTPEGLQNLKDLFLTGLRGVAANTDPDASTWGIKYSLNGSYSGKSAYNFYYTDPVTQRQTLYTLTFTDGAETFKGTMITQIPGRGQLKRDFTGKRLQVYKQ